MQSRSVRSRYLLSFLLILVPVIAFAVIIFSQNVYTTRQYVNEMTLEQFRNAVHDTKGLLNRCAYAVEDTTSLEACFTTRPDGKTIANESMIAALLEKMELRINAGVEVTLYMRGETDMYTVDWGAGEITRRIGLAAFDGTENWAVTASNNETTRFGVVVQNGQPAGAGLCSHTSWTTNIAPDTISAGIASSPSVLYLRLPVSLVANTANAIKTYLAAQNAAGTPVQVLYELTTPTTDPITVPVIPAYGGTEHIWSNADRMTVAYDMTAQAAHDKQQAQINALQALMTGG